jgi:hypothetical protein
MGTSIKVNMRFVIFEQKTTDRSMQGNRLKKYSRSEGEVYSFHPTAAKL